MKVLNNSWAIKNFLMKLWPYKISLKLIVFCHFLLIQWLRLNGKNVHFNFFNFLTYCFFLMKRFLASKLHTTYMTKVMTLHDVSFDPELFLTHILVPYRICKVRLFFSILLRSIYHDVFKISSKYDRLEGFQMW